VLLNKIDLLPYVDFPVDGFLANLRQVNPHAAVIEVSASHGTGVGDWRQWLRSARSHPGGRPHGSL
jgi:hydrogenase nickel incorporation protein HypB